MREIKELRKGWKFCFTDLGTKEMPDVGYEGWQSVEVPHDWAIYQEFSPDNDPQPLESSVLDYHENMIQIGRTGGLPICGTGWYVLDLELPDTHSSYALEFDGIMNHGEVYINGEKAAYRPYGYSSFSVDITPFIKRESINRIVVRVNSLDKTSRWYPGAGIYRQVRLVMCDKSHVEYQGIWVNAQYNREKDISQLRIACTVRGTGKVLHTIFDPSGTEVANCEGEHPEIEIRSPKLWDIESPFLYTLRTEIIENGAAADRIFTRFGIREAVFDRQTGFSLNGKTIKIQGVCMHHDCGMLGAAYNREVIKRRLTQLKEMGCNALRTTHNPPCPQTLDLCDELGILVMDEAFDEWNIPKAVNGYAKEFGEWAEKDLTDMIHRDRNHPCVILYSIGNEIPDQINPEGRETCRRLTSICHREDPSRPVTCGFNRPKAAVVNGLTEEVDIVGLNYCANDYAKYHEEHPKWMMIATETVSAVSSRGEYFLPAEIEMPVIKRENLQVNSYDYSAAACAYIPDIEFEAQRKSPFIAGQFVWSGYDYLGEPTPYREEWPSRSSYFGIFDLAGLRKDRYYAYAAEWGTKPVVHLIGHWNWTPGELVDIHCYTNLDRVRLYVNGKEINPESRKNHRVIFGRIPYAPGQLRAVGYKMKDGKEQIVCEDVVNTAEEPFSIKLTRDAQVLYTGDDSICFIEADIVDKVGNICPNADNRVHISVEGDGEYIASDAGDATCTRIFNKPYCDAFHGKLVIAVRPKETAGHMVVTVCSDGLKPASMLVEVRRNE